MVYQPMLEVLAYLRANGFKTFIVSGGGVEVHAALGGEGLRDSSRTGGRECRETKLEERNGRLVLVKPPEIDFIDDKEGKPVGI